MPGRKATIWFPDLAVSVALVTLVYVLFLFDGWHKLFRDSDTGWHIRTGEAILLNHVLPTSDPYSFTRAGAPWLDWEWAADVLSGAAHQAAGLRGVTWLYALAIAACSWLAVRLTWSAGGDFLFAGALTIPMLSTANLHWLARPHIFSWILLLAWILWMEHAGVRFTWRTAVLAGVFGAVWANFHGSFFFAPLVALVYAAGSALKSWIWDVPPLSGVRWYLCAAVFSSLGTLLNPYGLSLHVHVFRYLTDQELLARIGEFQTFNFHADGSGWILSTLAIAALGSVLALANRRPEHFLLGVVLIGLALRSARGLPLVALCLLPLANANIVEACRRARGIRPGLRWRLDAVLAYSARLRALDAGVGGWAIVPVVTLVIVAASTSVQAGFPASDFPVNAAAQIAQLPITARVLAPDKFGGYLIYRFSPERKVFFDGRSDFYGARFMHDYLRLLEVRPGWQTIATRFGFTHALLPNDYSLVAALGAAGWRQIYKDGTATLLAAPDKTVVDK